MPLPRRLVTAALACAAVMVSLALVPAGASARVLSLDANARVLVVGDSLAVGLKPTLERYLGEDTAWDAKSGRTTPQGLVALRGALKVVKPKTVVVSLGTNDGPDPTRFTSRVDKALQAIGPTACVVWADIYRPARKGPYVALNGVLGQEAARYKRLHLVHWNAAVARRSVALPDGLHPDAAGFAYRARMIAKAVKASCAMPAIDDDVPTPVGDSTTGGVQPPA